MLILITYAVDTTTLARQRRMIRQILWLYKCEHDAMQ